MNLKKARNVIGFNEVSDICKVAFEKIRVIKYIGSVGITNENYVHFVSFSINSLI